MNSKPVLKIEATTERKLCCHAGTNKQSHVKTTDLQHQVQQSDLFSLKESVNRSTEDHHYELCHLTTWSLAQQ